MKILILISAFLFLVACSSLTNYQEQPVVQLSGNEVFITTCNGMAEDWGSCHRKAKRTCANGYSVIEKTQLNDLVHREITFTCK